MGQAAERGNTRSLEPVPSVRARTMLVYHRHSTGIANALAGATPGPSVTPEPRNAVVPFHRGPQHYLCATHPYSTRLDIGHGALQHRPQLRLLPSSSAKPLWNRSSPTHCLYWIVRSIHGPRTQCRRAHSASANLRLSAATFVLPADTMSHQPQRSPDDRRKGSLQSLPLFARLLVEVVVAGKSFHTPRAKGTGMFRSLAPLQARCATNPPRRRVLSCPTIPVISFFRPPCVKHVIQATGESARPSIVR